METVKNQPPDDEWLQSYVLPEEYLLRHHPSACGSCYRRFESPNVIDLVAGTMRSSEKGHHRTIDQNERAVQRRAGEALRDHRTINPWYCAGHSSAARMI